METDVLLGFPGRDMNLDFPYPGGGRHHPFLPFFLFFLKKCYFGPEETAWCFLVEGVPSELALVLCPSPPTPVAAR